MPAGVRLVRAGVLNRCLSSGIVRPDCYPRCYHEPPVGPDRLAARGGIAPSGTGARRTGPREAPGGRFMPAPGSYLALRPRAAPNPSSNVEAPTRSAIRATAREFEPG